MSLGFSQEKLGEALGVTFQQVQKYEKGMNRIGASRLQAIADFLNVPVAFFFDGAGASRGREQHDNLLDMVSTRDGVCLIRAFNGIKDTRLRSRIVGMVQAIAGEKPAP